jgi:hypothetical protein
MTDRDHERREQLRDLPTELRGEVRSFYEGAMEADGFARRLRSMASELDRHADAIATRDEQATPLPEFAAQRASRRQYSVERKFHPEHDGDHIRIRDLRGTPDTSMVLSVVRAASAEGWRLTDYHESGDELLFVPAEGGESR